MKKLVKCLNCGKLFVAFYEERKFCSKRCVGEYTHKAWLNYQSERKQKVLA